MTNRFLLKQFAENGDKGVFGSYQAGNKTVSSDPATLQGLPAWTNGWADAISDGSHLPAMEEFQAVQYLICKAVKELYSEGIPVWMAGETYYKGAICSYIDSEGNVALYKNITGNNGTQQPALDIVNWATFSAGGGSVGAGGEMFDVVQKDHILSFDESKGYVPLGGYAYKEGVSGSRYGYPTFYETCVSEYGTAGQTLFGGMYDQTELALTGNGTMGTDSFACTSNMSNSAANTYRLFNMDNTNSVETSNNYATVEFYSDTPLNVKRLTWEAYDANRNPIEYSVSGSNDGVDYDAIISSQTAQAGAFTVMNMPLNLAFYKYYKIEVTSFNTAQGNCKRIMIDGMRGDIPVKKNANGHIFYDIANKSLVDSLYNSTGIAWLYGIDTASERIALPRNDYMARGEKGVVGNGPLGLTNGTTEYKLGGAYGTFSFYTGTAMFGSDGGSIGDTITPVNAIGVAGVSVDPTKSGIERVKDGSDKYLYMICGTTEEEVAMTEVTEVTTSENDTIPLFTHKYFEFKPNHISWVPANTVQSGDVYTSAYNTLVDCLTNNPYEIKVIDEADEQVGVDYSEYWIVNQTNETFRTPITVSEKALTGVVSGSAVEVADSLLYFKVDNAVQNLELIDVGRIEENKADTNSSNFTQTGKETIVGWGIPDYTAGISVSLPYTATQKCCLYITLSKLAEQTSTAEVYINGIKITSAYTSANNQWRESTTVVVYMDIGDEITTNSTNAIYDSVKFPLKGV
jgi:hypothetical protein